MKENLEQKVLELVNSSNSIVFPNLIAKKLSITWNVALRLLLELLAQGRIYGVKTERGWVFWKVGLKLPSQVLQSQDPKRAPLSP